MKFIFGAEKEKTMMVKRPLRGLSDATNGSSTFVADQFKELVKRNLSVPVTRYHL